MIINNSISFYDAKINTFNKTLAMIMSVIISEGPFTPFKHRNRCLIRSNYQSANRSNLAVSVVQFGPFYCSVLFILYILFSPLFFSCFSVFVHAWLEDDLFWLCIWIFTYGYFGTNLAFSQVRRVKSVDQAACHYSEHYFAVPFSSYMSGHSLQVHILLHVLFQDLPHLLIQQHGSLSLAFYVYCVIQYTCMAALTNLNTLYLHYYRR